MKKILLDTHTFIWWVEGSPQLTCNAQKQIENTKNECFLSLASSWEMAIKSSIGKLKLACSIKEYIPQHLSINQFKELPISFQHVTRVESLAFHHRDPFDRLLVAQALEEKMIIVSADPIFDTYKVKRIW
nr:type II toxin-antitoxin system VapC family toxin [Desulfobulbaceae bacterium]